MAFRGSGGHRWGMAGSPPPITDLSGLRICRRQNCTTHDVIKIIRVTSPSLFDRLKRRRPANKYIRSKRKSNYVNLSSSEINNWAISKQHPTCLSSPGHSHTLSFEAPFKFNCVSLIHTIKKNAYLASKYTMCMVTDLWQCNQTVHPLGTLCCGIQTKTCRRRTPFLNRCTVSG